MAIKDDKTRITAIIPKEIEQQISELADREQRSMSAMSSILIQRGLEDYKRTISDSHSFVRGAEYYGREKK